MLGLTDLDLKISERLEPLRQILAEANIPLRTLPKEAGKYSVDESINAIKTIIPEVSGDASLTDGVQFIRYSIVVAIALDKRYTDNEEKDKAVVEWVADKAIELLYNFYPFEEDGSYTQRSLQFQSYNLFKPEQGTWEAEIVFNCSRQLKAEPMQAKDIRPDEFLIELYAVLNQQDADPRLLKRYEKK